MPIIDCHAHLEERMLDVPTMIARLDRAGIDKVALIPTMNDPLPETPARLLAVMRGLMCSPLHSLAHWINNRLMTPEGHLSLNGKIYHIYQRPDNAAVAEVLRSHPERFLGWIFLNPRAPGDPVEELHRWHEVPGFIGVKLHPHWHGYAISEIFSIAERCEALRLPILIHLGFGERGAWQQLTGRFPRLKLIFAHAGMPHFARMWSDMARNQNLYLDVSSPYLDERLVRRAVAAVGPERTLFGTDAPYGFHDHENRYDYGHIKRWVERLPCRATAIDRIFGDNVEALLADRA
jgi:predicted TIM-barrel fold metal-dependent hydrolase